MTVSRRPRPSRTLARAVALALPVLTAFVGSALAQPTLEPARPPRSVVRQPDSRQDRINVAHQYMRQGRLAEALQLFSNLHREFPRDANVVRGYGTCLRQYGRYEEALTLYAEYDRVQARPTFVRERVGLLTQLGREAEALEVCLAVVPTAPGYIKQYINDEIVELSENPTLGERAYESLRDRFRGDDAAAVGAALLELCLATGRFQEAVEVVERLDPMIDGDGIEFFNLARRLDREGETALARELISRITTDVGTAFWHEAVLFKARLDESLGDAEAAVNELTRLHDQTGRPEDRYRIDMERARLLGEVLDRPGEAVAVYDSLLADRALRPRHEEVRLARAETQMRAGELAGALEDFRELSTSSRQAETRERAEFLVGEIYFHEGNIDSAAAAYLRQVEAFPAGPLANDALDRIFLFNENYEGEGETLAELGHVFALERNGSLDEAIVAGTELEAKVREATIHDDVLWALGSLWAESETPIVATTYLERLAAAHPESRLVPRALKRLGDIQMSEAATWIPWPPEMPVAGLFVPDRHRALQTFERLLIDHPLSIEAAEVRQLVSQLRKELPS